MAERGWQLSGKCTFAEKNAFSLRKMHARCNGCKCAQMLADLPSHSEVLLNFRGLVLGCIEADFLLTVKLTIRILSVDSFLNEKRVSLVF
jgi:hypothetical protein